MIIGKQIKDSEKVFTEKACKFIEDLVKKFKPQINNILDNRKKTQENINNGIFPTFLEETEHIRNGSWKVAQIPKDLINRTIEITGPVDRKMIINALNSNANCFMCDIEDSLSPSWENIVNGQINLYDLARKNISYFHKKRNKHYKINDYNNIPTLMVRPRGFHMIESHITLNGEPIPACLFDFGFHFYHNAKKLTENNSGPYFYLPKMQHYLEARLWNDIFNYSQDYLSIPRGTIRATVLVEHISLAFQMDEVLYELRHHSAGLNCGRWDYIFSFIKLFKNYKEMVLPDRKLITMKTHFMDSYVKLLTKTCHRRGIHAMGGMAAQIPVKNNDELNNKNLQIVYNDKKGEASAGMDGTWVAHPGLIDIARKSFEENRLVEGNNQLNVQFNDDNLKEEDLLKIPEGSITIDGIKENINACILYMSSWLNNRGAVAINNKMEDAATAEISRMQLWSWIYHKRILENGDIVNLDLIKKLIDNYEQKNVCDLLIKMLGTKEPPDFLTNKLYNLL